MNNKIYKTKWKYGGYAMLEFLFYISLFGVLSVVVINAMITMTKSFRETTIYAELIQSGTIMERMSREIRGAYDISSIGATDLMLATTDSLGANKSLQFVLSGANIQLMENSVFTGNLNAPGMSVTALSFSQISTSEGKAVKIFMTVQSDNDSLNRTFDFYDTVVLRGSY